MINSLLTIVFIIGTLSIYILSRKLNKKWNHPLTLPVLVSSVAIIVFLLISEIPYETYMLGGDWIHYLLGPAVVALAYPLYIRRQLLLKWLYPIFMGTIAGAFIGILSGIILAKLLQVDETIIYSLVPKSVTTPIAIEVTNIIGGQVSLTAVFVIMAGISGVFMRSFLFKTMRIEHVVGRGVGIGSASHAIGSAHSLEIDELEGTLGTVAMVVSAVIVSMLAPLLVSFIF
ncbi:hypothetical conserved protein [Oceanobacillus iheyensis HTE831]|uniref:Hypothetical conserved protein n=1 Tax=Oceanobacillus iheyensis (strain DSM 14371 / CIP 107618 / JCM 11309 / KCTC 3954 / HTE831) TaxID=221109 RepID=Q8ELT6_OCEIH|nr:LrgB family protein [Oceanobacillus iheyensis]BAC15087.1 hypothetical conserved protein [Oceanobacillus iheyensis HTE831]